MNRKEVANALKKAGAGYLLKKGYSSHFEVGLCKRGRLKADVLAFNYRLNFIILEVKSCIADFRGDKKWKNYLTYSHKMYFVMIKDTFDRLRKEELEELKDAGCGVLVLCETSGLLRARVKASSRKVEGKAKRNIIVRVAWRCGTNRSNTRLKRTFLNEKTN